MRTHNIEVTEAHARKGKRRSIDTCPLALAIRANFNAPGVGVGVTFGHWIDSEGSHNFSNLGWLPYRVRGFDAGGDFKPGVYQIVEVRNV